MIRTFCDCCGEEITERNTTAAHGNELGRFTAQVKPKIPSGETMGVQVITAGEGTWNKGHFCKYCVIDAINQLDDRPQAAPAPDVRRMVDRFLMWKLPPTFGPDCFVSFDREKAKANHSWPVGTNILTADEARAMLEHVLG